MDYIWWDYSYEPGTRCVTVRRWARRGTLFAVVEFECGELTWGEAQDVLDADSTYVMEQLLRGLDP